MIPACGWTGVSRQSAVESGMPPKEGVQQGAAGEEVGGTDTSKAGCPSGNAAVEMARAPHEVSSGLAGQRYTGRIWMRSISPMPQTGHRAGCETVSAANTAAHCARFGRS